MAKIECKGKNASNSFYEDSETIMEGSEKGDEVVDPENPGDGGGGSGSGDGGGDDGGGSGSGSGDGGGSGSGSGDGGGDEGGGSGDGGGGGTEEPFIGYFKVTRKCLCTPLSGWIYFKCPRGNTIVSLNLSRDLLTINSSYTFKIKENITLTPKYQGILCNNIPKTLVLTPSEIKLAKDATIEVYLTC